VTSALLFVLILVGNAGVFLQAPSAPGGMMFEPWQVPVRVHFPKVVPERQSVPTGRLEVTQPLLMLQVTLLQTAVEKIPSSTFWSPRQEQVTEKS